MPKLLIAVKSCWYDKGRGAHDLIRETWAQDVPPDCDLKFFMGDDGHTFYQCEEDEQYLPYCDDDYVSLPQKTREIARWGVYYDYDFIFLCDSGSLLILHHFMNYGFERFDYVGYCGLPKGPFTYRVPETDMIINPCYPWASGGGYFLSRKAMEVVANSEPITTAEDLSVGLVLSKAGIFLEDRMTRGYKGYIVDWIEGEDNTGDLTARRQWMTSEYKRIKEVCEKGECGSLIIPQQPRTFDSYGRGEERPRFVSPTPWDRSRRGI